MKKRTAIILIIILVILTILLIITTNLKNQILVRGALDRFYSFTGTKSDTQSQKVTVDGPLPEDSSVKSVGF